MLVRDKNLQFIFGRRLLVHLTLDLLQRPLYIRSLLAVLLLELVESQLIHLLLNQHQNFVYLLDQIHLLYHLALLHFLQVHLLLYLSDLPLFVVFHLIQPVYLLGFASFIAVQMQKK